MCGPNNRYLLILSLHASVRWQLLYSYAPPTWHWGTPGKGPGTSDWGTPGKDMGPMEVLWDGDGVPPAKVMRPVEVLWDGNGVSPWKGHGTSGSIMGWR